MKLNQHIIFILASFALGSLAQAGDVFKANNTTALNTTGSWTGGVLPTPADVAVWDAPFSNTGPITMGDSLSWAGIRIASPTVVASIRNTSGKTITLGSAGIDMGAASQSFALNPNVTVGVNQTWNISSGRVLTLANGVAGTGLTVTKNGAGTVSLGGLAVFEPNLKLDAGTVLAATGTVALTGTLSGTGGNLLVNSTGSLTLSASNIFSGGTTVAAGQLNLNHANALGTGPLTITGGSLDNTSGSPITLAGNAQNWNGDFAYAGSADLNLGSGAVTVNGNRILTVTDKTLTAGGTMTGTAGLTKAGAGTLAVPAGGTMTLTGHLGVNGGDLKLTGGSLTCSGMVFGGSSSATVHLDGGTLTTGPVTRIGGTASFNFNGGTLVSAADSTTFMSGLSAATVRAGGARIHTNGSSITVAQPLLHDAALGATPDGGLTLTGGGTLTLTGTSTYTGHTTVTAGTLVLGTGGSLAASPVIDLGTDGTLDGTGTGLTVASGQTLTGTGNLAGKLTIAAGATLVPGSSGSIGTLGGDADLVLLGTANFRLNKAGTFLSSDAVVSSSVKFGGTLTVTATGSALAAGNSFKLFDAGSFSGSFATLNLPGLPFGYFWDTSNLSVDGTLTVINTVPLPTFNPPAGSYVGAQSVTISSLGGSTIHYTTDGSDPMTSGTAQTGPTPRTGILIPVNATGFTIRAYATMPGASPSAVGAASYHTFPSGVWTEQGSGAWSEKANWLSGAVPAGAGIIADFGTLNMSGGFTVTLDGSRAIGMLKFGDVGNLYDWTLQADAASVLTLAAGTEPTRIHVENRTTTITAMLDGNSGLIKTGGGTLVLGAANSYSGDTTISGGTLTARINSSQNALGSSAVAVAAGSTLNLNNVDTSNYTTVSNVFSGGGRINLNFANAGAARNTFMENAFNGFTGTFRLSLASGATSTADKWTCHVAPTYTTAAALIIDPGTQFFVAPTITATFNGGITVSGTGNTENRGGIRVGGTLGGPITLAGNTSIGTEGGTISGSITSGAAGTQTLTLGTGSSTANATLNGIIGGGTGTIALVKTQAGTVTLAGTNTYTGPTTISAGTLQIGAGGTTGTFGSGEVTNNAQLVFNRSGLIDHAGVISGSGSLTHLGPGTLVLSGTNTYTGATALNGGTLLVNGALSPSSVVNAASGTILGGTGTITGTVVVNSGATLAPGDNGAGTLTAGAATLTGTYACQLDGASCDKLAVIGNLTLTGSTLDVAVRAGGSGQGPYLIATYTGIRTGQFASVPAGYTVDYATPNQVRLIAPATGDPFGTWTTAMGLSGPAAAKNADPDGDGYSNLIEFAANSNPNPTTGGGGSGPRVYPLMFTIGTDNALTYTIAVRKGATFAAAGTNQIATKDQVKYTVEAANGPAMWTGVPVTEATGQTATDIRTALGAKITTPALGGDWEWHTFRTDGGTATDPNDFIRLKVEEVAP